MKDFLAGWIIIQLIVLGAAHGSMAHKISKNTFECSTEDHEHPALAFVVVGAMLPLIAFMDGTELQDYCETQNEKI